MAKKEILEYEATYIIYGNKTMDEVAESLKISTRTLQLHMNKELKEINPELYKQVRERLDEISKQRNILGGKKGKRTTNYDIELINKIADELIENFKDKTSYLKLVGITNIRTLAEKYNIPPSTLYELLTKYLDEEKLATIKSIFEYNKTLANSKNLDHKIDIVDYTRAIEDDTGVKLVEKHEHKKRK